MFRKFTSFLHKEIFRASSQHSKVLPLDNLHKDVYPNQKKCINVKELKRDNHTSNITQRSRFERFRIFLEEYEKTFNRGTRPGDNIKDDFFMWCTGVLTISSAIVGHKWFKRNEKQECPLYIFNKDIVQSILLDRVNKSHIVLAVNSFEQHKTNEKETSTLSNKDKLEAAFERYQATTDKCNGSFLNGLGVKYVQSKKYKQAFAMFCEASEFDDSTAWFNMALSYEKGLGTKQSFMKAADCYKKAGERGHAKSLYNLASLYYSGLLKDEEKINGFHFARKAADLGLSEAQLLVGLRYAKQKDWKNAIKYFEMGVNQKNSSSMFNLAVCHENGCGTPKSNIKAISLYREAAEDGHMLSQFTLGEAYQFGQKGLKENLNEALHWFKLAAKNGHPEAKSRLEYVEYEIAQKNENDLLTLFESNTLLKILTPIQNVIHSSSFHKSASMPSLQKSFNSQSPLGPYLLEKNSLSQSTVSLCM